MFVGSFVPPAPRHVPILMAEFVEWLNSKELLEEAHPIQVAALAHYKFVYIHPFYDGNGRSARILMNLILMKSGYPPIIIKKEERLDYYGYLKMANEGDVKPFIRFIARCVKHTLEEYIMLCNSGIAGYGEFRDRVVQDEKLLDNQYEDAYLDRMREEATNELLYYGASNSRQVIKSGVAKKSKLINLCTLMSFRVFLNEYVFQVCAC